MKTKSDSNSVVLDNEGNGIIKISNCPDYVEAIDLTVKKQKFSINKFLVEQYKTDKSLRSEVKNGFAMISQKIRVKGLKLLVDAQISLNGYDRYVNAGSIIHIKEEMLHSAPWAKQSFESESVPEQFMIVDLSSVEFIEEK